MNIPLTLAIAGPATLASLAYLNARTSFSYDRVFLWSSYKSGRTMAARERGHRVNVFYTLEEHARSRQLADAVFLWYTGHEWTYKQTYDLVLKYGTWLKTEHGVQPKDIVAIDMLNSADFIFLWFAIWSIGAVPAFLNHNLAGDSLVHCVKTAAPRLLVVDDELRALVTQDVVDQLSSPDALGGTGGKPVKVVFLTAETKLHVGRIDGVREPDESRSNVTGLDTAALIYTSGTTGLPKASRIPWRLPNLAPPVIGDSIPWRRSDRMYTCMPLYHTSAAFLAVASALGLGSSVAIGRRFSTQTFWKDVRDSQATIIQYVGETCRYLLAAPVEHDATTGANLDTHHKVRTAFGNGLRPDVWDRFKQRFNIETIVEFYGQTEGIRALWNRSTNDFSRGAVGRHGALMRWLLAGSQIASVQVDWEAEAPWRDPHTGFCKFVGPNEPGEVLYRLDEKNVFPGYHRNDAANEKKILRDVFAKGDAWYRTGDVLRCDPEGRWFFHDRIGDTYRWKSENISTAEISAQLGQHASIQEANVYGVPVPHHDGRAGMASIILSPQHSPPTPQTMAAIATHLTARLLPYAVPLFIRVTGQMQLTGTNKQIKRELIEQGVDPVRVVGAGDELFWFRDGTYRPFGRREWEELKGGRVKL
ncbi:MAG: hypothetical protein M1816_006160 [Peltula sp. TS41687]|nr:MAG: hypothetical protein M1816_006160 [Peltula sp. TS41687]